MLAMLSCAMQSSSEVAEQLPRGDIQEIDSGQYFLHPSHPLAISERYFPSVEVASSILRPPPIRPSFSIDRQKPISDPQSAASSVGASNSNPLTPFSSSLTPPTPFKINKPKHERTISQAPMSSSPEQLKHLHRSGSNLASAFAASITRPFSSSTADSSSPPTTHLKRRPSPVLSHLATANSNLAWGSSILSNPNPANVRNPMPRTAPSIPNEHPGVIDESSSFHKTKLKNQDHFHNDGYAADSLLDPSKAETYSAYRLTYASMLLTWELPTASCKVLQYNKPSAAQSALQDNGDLRERESLITIGRGTPGSSTRDLSDLRLDIRNQCHSCDTTLPPGGSSKRCPACSAKQAPVLCQLCHSIISGLSSPCLNCGHVLHLSCRSYLLEAKDTDLDGECPTGCGCHCPDHLVINVATPITPNDRKHSISTATLFANEQEELGWRDVDGDTEVAGNESDPWEDVAYESLARNLGRKFLTPKPSQIWRGGETRKESLGGFPGARRSGSG